MPRTAVIVLAALLALGACAAEMPEEVVEAPERPRLIIGLIPEIDIFDQFDRHGPLIEQLSQRTGVDLELKMFPSYAALIGSLESSETDGGFLGSFAFALAHERAGAEPVARPVGLDGSSTYYGLIFVRKDSGIRHYRDLMGKRLAFVDPLTTAGYLLPLEFLQGFGVRDFRSVFPEFYFAGTHEAAIVDVLDGTADVGAAKSTVFARLAARDPRVRSELVFLAKSREVPENVLALRRDIDPEIRNALKQALLGVHEDSAGQEALRSFGALSFIETTQDDYATVYEYVDEVGIDLATYDYQTLR